VRIHRSCSGEFKLSYAVAFTDFLLLIHLLSLLMFQFDVCADMFLQPTPHARQRQCSVHSAIEDRRGISFPAFSRPSPNEDEESAGTLHRAYPKHEGQSIRSNRLVNEAEQISGVDQLEHH
jgi:hypothetical protein